MMKTKVCKAFLSLLCAVTLLVGVIPAAPVAAEMGCDFPWTEGKTLLEQIIERDGLLDGIWYPWINGGQSGHNLTGNDVFAKYVSKDWARVELDYYGADKVYREIYNLKAMGYNMMAWAGSIYGEGVMFDDYGDVIGIKQEYLDNARRLLDMCREIGMPVMWNVYFHSSSAPRYYGMRCWNMVTRMLGDRTVADHYAERFVKPLCEMLAEYPDVVALISIADEPENEIHDVNVADAGHFSGDRAMYGVSRDNLIYFMRGINNAVREVLPNVPRTVASNSMNKLTYAGFELDLMGHNQYQNNIHVYDMANFYTDADMILTEYNVGGDAKLTDQEFFAELKKFREGFMTQGYKGGFQWCWMPNGTDAQYYLLNTRNNTDFKETVGLLRHYIDDYRAEYRGETVAFDTPVMYANDGTGLVEWIPSRNATKLTIERSDDGGTTWKTVLDNVDPSSYIKECKGSYKDTSNKPKSGYCYRVTMSDGTHTATSEPNNKAGSDKAHKVTYKAPTINYPTGIDQTEKALFGKDEIERARLSAFAVEANRPLTVADNLITNGSFESSGGQWNNSTFLQYAQVVSDSTAPSGSKSLQFNTAGQAAGWYTFEVTGLKPDTAYTFSTWIKGDYLAEDNQGEASVGVWDPELNGFMVYWEYYRGTARPSRLNQQIYPTAWDNDWHLRSVKFVTKSDETSVTIALYGGGSNMWLDDMALFPSNRGVKYVGDNVTSTIKRKYYYDDASCSASESLTKNMSFSDTTSKFWQTGDGWRNGFLSIESTGSSTYGKALKYSEDDAVGNYYVKWVDVKPDTYYVFAGNVKILKDGAGGIALVEDNYKSPRACFYSELDSESFGTDWYEFAIRLYTSSYTRIGIAFCDAGGEGWYDNIRLFETDDTTEIPVDPATSTQDTETTTSTTMTLPDDEPTSTTSATSTEAGESTTSTGADTTTTTAKKAKEEGVLLSAITLKGEHKVLGIILYVALAAVIATVVLTIVVLARKKKTDTPDTPTEADAPDTPDTPDAPEAPAE